MGRASTGGQSRSRANKPKHDAAGPLPAHADLVIVGGGCHAAALLMRLLTKGEVLQDPNPPIEGYRHAPKDVRRHLFKTPVEEGLKQSIVVLDRSGGWMLNWQKAYQALDIPHLRSPEGLHPDPYDHSALPVYAKHTKMEDEFIPMVQLDRGVRHCGCLYCGPFQLPSVRLFAKFCQHLVQAYGLESLLFEGEVTELRPLDGGFELEVSRGQGSARMTASNVVLARGPTCRKRVPDWAEPLLAPSCPCAPWAMGHAWDIIAGNGTTGLAPEQQEPSSPWLDAVAPTDRVLVIGGGLTSGHLVTLAAKRGAQVQLVLRGPRKVKQFDLILPWFGNDRWTKRSEFEKADVSQKLTAILKDRDGGSLTPEQDLKIQPLEAAGRCEVREYTQVTSAVWIGHESTSDGGGGYWEVCFDDDTDCHCEKIWLATGSRMDADSDPLLQQLLAQHPIPLHRGFPDVTQTLRWAPDVPLYVMGGLAALQLGPDAVNLAGGLRGAFRIAACLKQQLIKQREAREAAEDGGSDTVSTTDAGSQATDDSLASSPGM